MKICPKCQSNYTDDTLQFCLQDGAALDFVGNDTSDLKTVSFEENATVVSQRPREKITFDLENPAQTSNHTYSDPREFTTGSEAASSNTLLIVLATAFAMIILFGIVGVGAWFYLKSEKQVVENSNNSTGENTKTAPLQSKSPNGKNTPAGEKTPSYDREKLIEGVGKQISSWKSLAEARNLDGYMAKYGLKIDYYTKRGASREYVKKDKQKAFSAYTSINTKLSNISITPASDGKKATAVFDKEWDFSGPGKNSTGKVQTQLKFEKIGDDWLIVSERDLKVYYVKK